MGGPAGLHERGNDTSRSTGRSGRQNAATRRNMRREERVTVQGPVKEQQPDGMSHWGGSSPSPDAPQNATLRGKCVGPSRRPSDGPPECRVGLWVPMGGGSGNPRPSLADVVWPVLWAAPSARTRLPPLFPPPPPPEVCTSRPPKPMGPSVGGMPLRSPFPPPRGTSRSEAMHTPIQHPDHRPPSGRTCDSDPRPSLRGWRVFK